MRLTPKSKKLKHHSMEEIQENVSLAPLTTFEITGTAKYFVEVRSEDDAREAIAWARSKSVRYVILSGGSNVLVPPLIDALVIHIVGDVFELKKDVLEAWTGTNLLALIRAAGAQGFGGWEKLAGIPGTVGGAVRGNAGAFGSEIRDLVISVRAFDAKSGNYREFTNAECDFSYRHSYFKDHPEWIITQVRLRLHPIAPEESGHIVEETIAEREKRHLQNVRAAGSYFMNPVAPQKIVEQFEKEKGVKSRENRVPAGWLIEKAGMKGAVVGGAIASLQHPNYIVNLGSATSDDVQELAQKIKGAVQTMFGVELKEEAALLT